MAATVKSLLLPVFRRHEFIQVCRKCAKRYSTVSVQKATSEDPMKWQLASAICLERQPVITQERNDIENRYNKMVTTMELEGSLLSDHERQMKKDLALKQAIKEGKEVEKSEGDEGRILTTFELEDKWQSELKAFSPAPRITEADEKNDMKSTKRKLDRKLVLIIKRKFENDQQWLFPMAVRNEGESMRQAAENALKSMCGEKVKSFFIGNSPCGFFRYKFPKSVTVDGYVGMKVFYFKAYYNGGDISVDKKLVTDYKWVTHDELEEYLPKQYYKRVDDFLLEFP